MAKGQLALSEDQVLPQLGSCQLALHWFLPAFSLLHTIYILLWHSLLRLYIPLDMAILCILFLWMFFPSVAMPCISHPLYFTRYKAKLFLFISCRERRLGEDPNLLSAIKVPISSFLDSINRTNKFVFILYLIGLGEIVYLVTLC